MLTSINKHVYKYFVLTQEILSNVTFWHPIHWWCVYYHKTNAIVFTYIYVCVSTCMYATHEWMHAEITENVVAPQDVDIGKQMGVLCQVSEQQTHLFSPCFIVLIMLPYSEHEKLNFRYYFAWRKAFCLFVFILLFCFALFLVV